uniref:Uncharacterized protein n=1 Tax=Aegilops tauschii subsp. strangulata TaxID=200361 RepID=A0A453QH43_AEGTS
MATVGPPGAFRRITVHYSSTAGDDANHDDFLEYVIGDVLQHQVRFILASALFKENSLVN